MGKTVFTFSGQGTQYYLMGHDLYENDPIFKYWMDEADAILSDLTDLPLVNALYYEEKGVGDPLTTLQLSHPALFAVQYAAAMSVSSTKRPDLLIGSSLGEFVALAIGNVFSFEEGLTFIAEQASLFTKLCQPGVMVAIFSTLKKISSALDQVSVPLQVAASLTENNHTISCNMSEWKLVEEALQNHDLLYQVLPVSRAFHSREIHPARDAYMRLASQLALRPTSLPIVSTITGSLLDEVFPSHLWDVVSGKISLVQTLYKYFVPNHDVLIDFSPTGSISVAGSHLFGQKIAAFKTMTPFQNGIENINKIRSHYQCL